jgi:UDP-2-acetamido-3-amino-2,3-dideoxy-glucuronate N-acetyltransferase
LNTHIGVKIHVSADVADQAKIGAGTTIWHQAQVRGGASIGSNCILGKGAYVDTGVTIGENVKIQNYASIYHGVVIEDGVFCGPHCVFTNDKVPRAVNPDGSLKRDDDWVVSTTLVRQGASIGAGAVIVCGVTIGCWAMIGAGAVARIRLPLWWPPERTASRGSAGNRLLPGLWLYGFAGSVSMGGRTIVPDNPA